MKNLSRLAAALLLLCTPAYAVQKTNASYRGGVVLMDDNGLAIDATNPLPVNATASISGFTPSGNVASRAVSTSSASVALPSDTVALVTNTGSNTVFLNLSVGAGTAATTDMALVAGATVGLTRGSNTYINAITASSTSTLRIAGGTGLVSGYGGGSSGGGASSTVAIDQTTPGTTNGVYVTNNGTAIDAATSGQTPSTIACNTLSATPTAGTTAHTNPVSCDLYGNLITQPYSLPQNRIQGAVTTAMTGTTSTAMTGMGAPGASLYNYITSISCQNSHATVGTLVKVQDGSGGTTMFHLAAAPAFGGDNTVFPTPWKQTTSNTALYVEDATTGASVTCKATGFKGP